MILRVPLNVPADVAEISSGYVLTKIDELEAGLLMEDGHYSCIGCLTKLQIDEIYNGNIENAVFDTLETF